MARTDRVACRVSGRDGGPTFDNRHPTAPAHPSLCGLCVKETTKTTEDNLTLCCPLLSVLSFFISRGGTIGRVAPRRDRVAVVGCRVSPVAGRARVPTRRMETDATGRILYCPLSLANTLKNMDLPVGLLLDRITSPFSALVNPLVLTASAAASSSSSRSAAATP